VDYSPYQIDIFDFVEHGVGNGIANAVAGSGKSTTIREAYRRALMARSGLKAVFLAFNRSIVMELKEHGVEAKTLNSLGMGALFKGLDFKPELDSDKIRNIIAATVEFDLQKRYGMNIAKVVGLAKGLGIVPNHPQIADRQLKGLTPDTEDTWYGILDQYDIDIGDDPKADEAELIGLARMTLVNSIKQMSIIDFDDQKYLPVIMGLPPYLNDWIFLDECQDLNIVDRALVRMALKRTGRIFAVGDPHQAIYGWRGADVDSFDQVRDDFNCREFPLSVCYRCPTEVIDLAQTWVPHIQAAPGKQAGMVKYVQKYDHTSFKPRDLVLCRNNAPLVQLAYGLMVQRVPVVVMGRDFGRQIMTLVRKLGDKIIASPAPVRRPDFDAEAFLASGATSAEFAADKPPTFEEQLIQKVIEYRQREVAKAEAKNMQAKAARIHDMTDCILHILDGAEQIESMSDVDRELNQLFSDDAKANAVVLSSIHRAKGGQSKRVFILDWFLLPSKYAKTASAAQQEANLQYVAVTRAQEELRFITSDVFGKGIEQ